MYPVAFEDLPTAEFLHGMYCRGMRYGWVSEEKPTVRLQEHPLLTGCTSFQYDEFYGEDRLPIRLTDTWGAGQGCTTLELLSLGVPRTLLWAMHCSGSYDRAVFPFLKKILSQSWSTEKFQGCRGPALVRQGTTIYRRTFTGTFKHFDGTENIWRNGCEINPCL